MIRFSGPAFKDVDNRLMALHLVKQGLTEAAMFTHLGEAVQWAEVLYEKPVLVQRGSFRPVTRATVDVPNAPSNNSSTNRNSKARSPSVSMEMTCAISRRATLSRSRTSCSALKH